MLRWIVRCCCVRKERIPVRKGGQCDAERIKITLRILEIDEALNQILVLLGPAGLNRKL